MATQQITGRQIADNSITNAKVDASAAIASTKLATWAADRNAGGNKLTNLANGTAAGDAINKGQLDAAVTASAAGLAIKAPVRVASTANVAGSYSATGGTSARGQFTGMSNAIDGVSLAANDRVLLKDQSTGAQNGWWVVTTLGSGSNGVWDRAPDADSDEEVTDGTYTFVGEGTANAGKSWVLTTNEAIVLGGGSGTALTFTQFGAGSAYTADETTLTLSTAEFQIKTGGVGTTQLADDSVTQAKIADDAVGADQLASNAVVTASIVNANVTAEKLASSAVETAKIASNAVTGAKISFLAQTVSETPNGAITAFTMSGTPTAASLIVWVRGVRQRPTTDFTFSGATLTFTTAPDTGDDVAVFGMVA